MQILNDFVLSVATLNGSGSQSANTILTKAIFRMGLSVGAKNLFPSNIAGLPTWFTIRANDKGYTSRKVPVDLVMAMNPATLLEDIASLKESGVFLYNSDLKFEPSLLRKDVLNIGIPFKQIIKPVTESIKLKKLLTNMAYVGVLSECLSIDEAILKEVIADFFNTKPSVVESNIKAIEAGIEYAKENKLSKDFPYKLKLLSHDNKEKVIIDGNTASALGALWGGCSFFSWYPITPSSSIAESFSKYAEKARVNKDGKKNFAIVQAEDELSAISMVIGAGWAGARSMTTTSGPGLSLMSEAAGLSYFAEIPSVIWDVQRVGPSTGLPTRTMQADITSAAHLSHGDTQHVVLIPATPEECFEFAQLAFDLAEELQTLVIVLSDLDLGMNLWMSDELKPLKTDYKRGKVLTKKDLDQLKSFKRYEDKDKDGVCARTLPGTDHPGAAYFCRGTGHDDEANYSESGENYRKLLDRLKLKTETAKKTVPQPELDINKKAKVGLVAFGSSNESIQETRDALEEKGIPTSFCRLRALPLNGEVKDFIEAHDKIYVIEQNRDGQMLSLLKSHWPEGFSKYQSITQYDGLPLTSKYLVKEIAHV